MISEQFRRVELAYAMSRAAASSALHKFPEIARATRMVLSGPTIVETLYFDDIMHTLYRQGRDKSDEQMQLRIRSYADSSPSCKYIEIKIKKGECTDKLRTTAHIGEWGSSIGFYLSELPSTDTFILSRFRDIIKERDLRPTLLMRYERTALHSSSDESFRLTADENLAAKDVVGVRWDSRDLLPLELVVFELKTMRPMDTATSRAIGKLRLGKPQPVSKFEKCTETLFDVLP